MVRLLQRPALLHPVKLLLQLVSPKLQQSQALSPKMMQPARSLQQLKLLQHKITPVSKLFHVPIP